ncbi:hypothetical protein [Allorhizocola rhizosphaerae]|uniref:hypothetical protein n=1 Tax=Allorhizocola rhizosphaerae TaxID=1872709 RepID=UPI0013C36824|nr:hypothetical protein [Allorhizocola rhizosphaerae]
MSDLLDVSAVGLYEFMWLLNKPELQLGAEERESCARMALERLLADPRVRLVKLRWPQPDILEELTLNELPEPRWAEPAEDGTYFALHRAQ